MDEAAAAEGQLQDSNPPDPTEPSNDEGVAPQFEEEEAGDGAGAQDMEEGEPDDADQDLATASADVEETAALEAAEAEEDPPPTPPVKRKRGRPPKSQSVKQKQKPQSAKQPARKRDEEDVCFVCFDGGSLVCCDRRGCPKVYHAACIHQDEDFFKSSSKWNCGWHICSSCEKAAQYMCYTCTYSLCKGCIKESRFVCVRGNKGFCETCYSTVMLIESNVHADEDKVGINLAEMNNFECLFKAYWFYLKEKHSLTLAELQKGKKQLKESAAAAAAHNGDSTSDELYDGNDEEDDSSDSSSGRREGSASSRKKARRRSRAAVAESAVMQNVQNDGGSIPEGTDWASKELLEFVAHMKGGDLSVLSQFDVQALLLEYIKQNNLRDPRKKSQIICDLRLVSLFGKARVGHFEMLKLLELHFRIKDVPQVVTDDTQGAGVDLDSSQMDSEAYLDGATKGISDKRRKGRRKVDEREPQTNLDDYAAIDVHNICLIYLRRNLIEDLLDESDKFVEKIVGSFVRIRISGSKQDMYRLVQVVGTSKAPNSYKTGRKTTDFTLEILNLNKKEIITIDSVSNQDFTEEECKRLRQSIKCGLIRPFTVGDIQEKARLLQVVRVSDLLETEKQRLTHLRDRASETGRRKELRECVEKLQLLSTPEERIRRLNEVPEIHSDPKMDPDNDSADEEESDDKNQDVFSRPRDSSSVRKGGDLVSPSPPSNWTGGRKGLSFPLDSKRNARTGGARDKLESHNNPTNRRNESPWTKDQDARQTNTWETGRRPSSATGFDASTWNDNQTAADPTETVTAQPTSEPNEIEKIWNYRDPAGKIQGPFSMVQLRKWSTTGYFPTDMRIWRASESEDDSILLNDALNGKFEKDLPQWEPPQPATFAAGTESRPTEQEDRRHTFNLATANSNSIIDIEHPNAGGWASSAPLNPNPYGPPSVQGGGVQSMINTGMQNTVQDLRSNWGVNNNPRPPQPNWGSSGQVPPTNNQWGNAAYSMPTQLPGNQVWPNSQGMMNVSAPATPHQPMGSGWGPMNAPATPTPTVHPMASGWGTNQVPPSPWPTPPQPMGGGWGMPPVARVNGAAAMAMNRAAPITNQIVGAAGWGSCPASPPNIANRMGEDRATHVSHSQMGNNQAIHSEHGRAQSKNAFFESDCPSPTPSNEIPSIADTSTKLPEASEELGSDPAFVSSNMDNMSPIRGSDLNPIPLVSDEKESGHHHKGPSPSGENRWELKIPQAPQDAARGDLWSLPSPTPTSTGQSGPSQSGWGNNSQDTAGTGRGISPNAKDNNLNRGWGTVALGSENAAWGAPSQQNANPTLGWGAVQENTSTAAGGWGAGGVWGEEKDTNRWGSEQNRSGDHYKGEESRRSSFSRRDSRFDGDSRHDSRYRGSELRNDSRRGDRDYHGDERMHRDRGGRSSRLSPRGEGKGQGVCKFHENGYCKKGARCNYLHT